MMTHNESIGLQCAHDKTTTGFWIAGRTNRRTLVGSAGSRDIDLVMRRESEIAFVEVKARRKPDFGGPVEAVHWRKQRELSRAAQVWVDRNGTDELAYRFDVVGILMEGDRVRVRYVPNAFPLRDKSG